MGRVWEVEAGRGSSAEPDVGLAEMGTDPGISKVDYGAVLGGRGESDSYIIHIQICIS